MWLGVELKNESNTPRKMATFFFLVVIDLLLPQILCNNFEVLDYKK